MSRVVLGVVIGVPIGWLLSEIRRGWHAGAAPSGKVPPHLMLSGGRIDPPAFAADLAYAPRQPGEPAWWTS